MAQVKLHVVEGPDRGAERLLAPGVPLVVGRAAECSLRLNDAQCSRRHCLVELRPRGVWIEDLGSRSGTLLLGRALHAAGALVPPTGAKVLLGGTELGFEVSAGPPSPAPRVPGFVVQELLGEGGSGEVYAGQDVVTGQRVALKFLQVAADEVTLARAGREARLASVLEHPGLARVLRVIPGGERLVLVRELAEGQSLAERLRQGALPAHEVFAIGAAVADALQAAHQGGVIHRDVKPGNIVIGAGGPRLIDFDLALGLKGSLDQTLTRLTQPGQGLGTLCYLPPEQLDDARNATVRSDVYGLGVTLYHALSGRPPFSEVAPEEFLDALTTRGPKPLPPSAKLSPAAAAVLTRAYAIHPAERYESAAAFAAALRS